MRGKEGLVCEIVCCRFVAGPAFILAANNLVDKWVRESVVCAVHHFIALAGHLLFLVSLHPLIPSQDFLFLFIHIYLHTRPKLQIYNTHVRLGSEQIPKYSYTGNE